MCYGSSKTLNISKYHKKRRNVQRLERRTYRPSILLKSVKRHLANVICHGQMLNNHLE